MVRLRRAGARGNRHLREVYSQGPLAPSRHARAPPWQRGPPKARSAPPPSSHPQKREVSEGSITDEWSCPQITRVAFFGLHRIRAFGVAL
jgi:hypothetical protein